MKQLLLSLTAIICLFSCGRHPGSDTAYDSIDESNFDSSLIGEVPEDTVPSKTILSFESASEIKEWLNSSEDSDKYSTGILPVIADASTEYAEAVINSDSSGFIVVDKNRMKVLLFDQYGRMVKSYGMACAKNYGTKHKRRDSRTPEGLFTVKGVYDSSEWLFTDDDGKTSDKKGQFGPRFIRLSVPQIGIHGTCAPWSIGHRTSHGCIRITNENILELVELVEPGMPVIIIPGRKDMEVNRREGVTMPWFATSYGATDPSTQEKKVESSENRDSLAVETEPDHTQIHYDSANKDTLQSVNINESESPDSTFVTE